MIKFIQTILVYLHLIIQTIRFKFKLNQIEDGEDGDDDDDEDDDDGGDEDDIWQGWYHCLLATWQL